MKLEKLPSGSYRIRKMYKRQMYTVVFDYKPTQKEAVQAIAAELDKVRERERNMTFESAAKEYIESKRNILSPSTIRGYNSIIKCMSPDFLNKNIHDLTTFDIQIEINKLSKKHSPKTIRNHHGFISAVLGTFRPNLKLNTTLPQKVKNEPYIPSDEDIRKILEYAAGTKFEIPIVLACYGMRRSEICALTLDDIGGDVVRITKALVQDENKKWITKTTKTTASTREIVIPEEIVQKIQSQGYIYNGHPNSITCFLSRAQESLNIPHFSIHKLRHYFASKMSAMNVPEENIMRFGGWETDYVMKGVYRHALKDENMKLQREASRKLGSVLFSSDIS